MAQDAVSVAPDQYKVLFEKDRVRVLEVRYGPGQTSHMHSHPDSFAVSLTPAKARFTLPDGQSVDMELQAGEAVFIEGQKHTVENTGAAELRVILVEVK